MLWTSYAAHTQHIGSGISAMPSMHVATTAWIALALSSLWPKLRVPCWIYWLVIFVGSFALGWHYFLDGVVGTIGAIGCWMLAGRFIVPAGREPRDRSLAPIG
jgi:membrane-associated phospholipid phosphatase